MKTRELIRLLQEEDPSGELEVNCAGGDIHFVSEEPGFHDGPYTVLVRDPAMAPCYNIVGVRETTHGKKIILHTLSVEDVIANDPRVAVHAEIGNDAWRSGFEQQVERWRVETIGMRNDLERDGFAQWAKLRGISADDAAAFYDQHYTFETPLPDDLLHLKRREVVGGLECEVTPSWFERRQLQYDREVEVVRDGDVARLVRRSA